MDQLSHFISGHWILVIAFMAVALALMMTFVRSLDGVTVHQAVNLINREDALVVDVRNENEYTNGHIVGAMSVPFGELASAEPKLGKYKDRTILVCCQSGGSSNSAVKVLKGFGFSQVQLIKGGILSWQQENLPLDRGAK